MSLRQAERPAAFEQANSTFSRARFGECGRSLLWVHNLDFAIGICPNLCTPELSQYAVVRLIHAPLSPDEVILSGLLSEYRQQRAVWQCGSRA